MLSFQNDVIYEPYTEQTQLISLGTMELAKIGDYEDYIYKSEGKWYKYGAIGKVVLDGTENWTYGNTAEYQVFYADLTNYLKSQDITTMCNYYRVATNNTGSGSAYAKGNNTLSLYIGSQTTINRVYIRNDSITSLNDFKTWLSTHNTIVYYQTATPEITEITDTTLIGQLDSLLALKTNRTITNMFTVTDNETPTLAVLYRQDLTTLLNNLTSAILSLGNNT